MSRSFRSAVCGIAAIITAFAFAPPASAHWASEDGDFDVAQYDQANQVCHDGMTFQYATDQVLYSDYLAGSYYDVAREVAKERQWDQDPSEGALAAVNADTGQQLGSTSSFVLWNPTRTLPYEYTKDGDGTQDGIHLLEGTVSITFSQWLRSKSAFWPATNVAVWHPNNAVGVPFDIVTPVEDCYLHATITHGRRVSGSVQVILHGTSNLDVDVLTPSTFRVKFAGVSFGFNEPPTTSAVRDVDGDGWPDLVLTYAANSNLQPVLLRGQTSSGGLLQGSVS